MQNRYLRNDFSANFKDGKTRFRIFAPALDSLDLEIEQHAQRTHYSLQPSEPTGFSEVIVDGVGPGDLYRYRLPNGELRPDPASRFQPQGVHLWSQVVDPNQFAWTDDSWAGIQRTNLVIYEAHIGTWTQAGTYRAAMERLPELVELGITAVELMPLADTAGQWNWGYDGVCWFAPRHNYGTPEDLREFVDACHRHGLAVFIDVVYNHLGPEGNYWGDFGSYVSKEHTTPWGDAPNFDGPDCAPVRALIVANAIYWLDEFHFDGLRVDAAHCTMDHSERHILTEVAIAVAEFRKTAMRQIHLTAESNVYDPEMTKPADLGGHGFDAQWCDDFLHSMYATLNPGEHRSNRVYLPQEDLLQTLRGGYVYSGTVRQMRRRVSIDEINSGAKVDQASLVYAIQNHDFIGNHPDGLRLDRLCTIAGQRAAATMMLLTPGIPLLFMGEEYASPHPFLFFVDFGDAHLREAVENGRRTEYPQHDWSGVESPLSHYAFEKSRVGSIGEGHEQLRGWYRDCLRIRRQWKEMELLRQENYTVVWEQESECYQMQYNYGADSRFVCVRLHADTKNVRPLKKQLTGRVLMLDNCTFKEPSGDETAHLALGAFGVVIGEGILT